MRIAGAHVPAPSKLFLRLAQQNVAVNPTSYIWVWLNAFGSEYPENTSYWGKCHQVHTPLLLI